MTQPKLTRIPGSEATVKHSFTLRKSTSDQLQAYHAYYCTALGLDPEKVALKDVAEQMLLDFMNSDRDFQRSQTTDAAVKPAAPKDVRPQPAQGSALQGVGSAAPTGHASASSTI